MTGDLLAFRREMASWVRENAPDGLASLAAWATRTPETYRYAAAASARDHPCYRTWEERFERANLVCPQWPEEWGGRAWGADRAAVFADVCAAANVPLVDRGMGESLVAPALFAHGDDEQRSRLLPLIKSGEDRYCQGYSEPNFGSDLGGVQTRGVVDGDELVITGQKVWSSGASRANMVFVLCRTDFFASKHRGLSFVLVPLSRENGIEVRPIRMLNGMKEFAELFFDNARAPLENVIGGLNEGWKVAMTTLSHERGVETTTRHLGYLKEFWDLADTARERGCLAEPQSRQGLARAYTDVQLMRYAGLRTMDRLLTGRAPGPSEAVAKLFWSEAHKRFGELAMHVAGMSSLLRPDGEGYVVEGWQDVFLGSRAGTIHSGTSEIQRNIIAERVLGLPKN